MSKIQICDTNNAESFLWSQEAAPFRPMWNHLLSGDSETFIKNCRTNFLLCSVDGHFLPATVNHDELDNSYVCSPYTSTIRYPLVELKKVNSKLARTGIATIVNMMAPALRSAEIDRVVCINNWMLSTNLYPDWDGWGIKELVNALIDQFPNHAILLRSLNEHTNPKLLSLLRRYHFSLAPSRQVYLFDKTNNNFLDRKNCQTDLQLLKKQTNFQIATHQQLTETDFDRITELYGQLYLKKYTPLNPQFSSKLIKRWWETKTLNMTGLRNRNGILDGILGEFCRSQTITAPLVGYDTSLPQSVGLYRLLMALAIRKAAADQWTLNLSSGAAEFKRLRGGVPQIEYTAIYYRHLPAGRRAVWKTLSLLLTQIGARVLKRFKL